MCAYWIPPGGRVPAPLTPSSVSGRQPAIQIHLLGPAVISGPLQVPQAKQEELLYALALNMPAGVSGSKLATMLGRDPDHAKPRASLRQMITRTRRCLEAAGGRISYAHGRYTLSGAWLDWADFLTLAHRGRQEGSRADLRAALELVRGEPCDEVFFWWLDAAIIEAMRAEITDTAALLARLELSDDPAGSARAARAGLAADPASEPLWRAVMAAEAAAGNAAGIHRAWHYLCAAIADISPGGAPHPDTIALYQHLTGASAAAAPLAPGASPQQGRPSGVRSVGAGRDPRALSRLQRAPSMPDLARLPVAPPPRPAGQGTGGSGPGRGGGTARRQVRGAAARPARTSASTASR